ncbi:uncharacterized protein LOC113350192 [Papaver somniferum]|uniref:uncharacterized protein LOC113350192 n=1 Tax=Papaver somniferum TaxID=3469 RepID=UPI000E6FADED|nr:uncharacterized protein LOC113350192 [Papaver somniferum]
MEDDEVAFVQSCDKCQIHGNLVHAPSTPLHSISSSWPFYSWGLDIIGKINPPSSKHHEYIITATEYFTKWIESIPLRGTTRATIAAFIKEYIICRFGGNGQDESTNKTLIRIFSRTVYDNPRECHEQLPMAQWAYQTTPRSSIGVSPYSLVYGAYAILPAEIKIPSARIAAASGVHWNEVEASNSRIADLDTLDSRRGKAEEHTQAYRNRISRAYDKTAYGNGYYKIIKVDGGKLEAVIIGKWLKAYHA